MNMQYYKIQNNFPSPTKFSSRSSYMWVIPLLIFLCFHSSYYPSHATIINLIQNTQFQNKFHKTRIRLYYRLYFSSIVWAINSSEGEIARLIGLLHSRSLQTNPSQWLAKLVLNPTILFINSLNLMFIITNYYCMAK
jgi:hypothetical protein